MTPSFLKFLLPSALEPTFSCFCPLLCYILKLSPAMSLIKLQTLKYPISAFSALSISFCFCFFHDIYCHQKLNWIFIGWFIFCITHSSVALWRQGLLSCSLLYPWFPEQHLVINIFAWINVSIRTMWIDVIWMKSRDFHNWISFWIADWTKLTVCLSDGEIFIGREHFFGV